MLFDALKVQGPSGSDFKWRHFFCDVNKQLFKNLPYLFSLLVYTTRVENIVTILSEHKR